MTPRTMARCPHCGLEARFPGTVRWCPCRGWLEELEGEHEPSYLADGYGSGSARFELGYDGEE